MNWSANLAGPALEIARTPDSPLRVMAGPGTGKTFALTRRVARLLSDGVDPRRILAITFTRTAAASLVTELLALGIAGCDEIKAGTLHSFCLEILCKHSVLGLLGRVPRPVVTFNDHGVLRFEAAPLLQDLGCDKRYGAIRDCTKRIRAFEAAWARLQTDTPGWARDVLDQQFERDLDAWLLFHKAILLGELVRETLRHLRNNPASAELTAFDHVLADEYQDLNKAEQVLLDTLASNASLVVVGDEDQSIYSFRYAHPQGIEEFSQTHPGTHDETLSECRRCPTRVVQIANHLIRQNHPTTSADVVTSAAGNPPGQIHIVQWPSLDEELAGLARYIEHLVSSGCYTPAEILVLSPRRYMGYALRDELVKLHISTHSFYHEQELESDEAQEAFAYLTLLAFPDDCIALRFLLGYGTKAWLSKQYSILRSHCEQTGLTPWQALEQVQTGSLSLKGIARLSKRFGVVSRRLTLLSTLPPQSVVDELLPAGEAWAASLRELACAVSTTALDVPSLFDEVRTTITQPEVPEGPFVRVMSLHKSKGLTSKAVVVQGCIQGLIPTLDSDLTPVHYQAQLEEQRRLFYVAITRCTEALVLSSVTSLKRRLAHKLGVPLKGGNQSSGLTIASQFMSDMGPIAPRPCRGDQWVIRRFV